jgi:competence protein ComEC
LFALAAFIFAKRSIATWLVLATFASAGALCHWTEANSVRPDRIRRLISSGDIASSDVVELTGTLSAAPELTADGSLVLVAVDRISYRGHERSASGTVRFFTVARDTVSAGEYDALDLRYGSVIRVACNIKREEEFQNPGVIPRTRLLDRQGIDASCIVKSPLLIEKIGDTGGFTPLGWSFAARQWLIERFRTTFTASTAGVLAASMLGDKYLLDKPTANAFREGGTFHVLVISGLHITFIGGLLLLIVRAFTRKGLTQFILAAGTLWLYALAVGADVPVVRATLMFTILLFSSVVNRRGSLLNALGGCVIVLLVLSPSDIFDASFQLTVVSVTAIVAMGFPLIERSRAIGSWMPTAARPFPPSAPRVLVRFFETLYWRPSAWKIENSRQVWSARIFKSPFLPGIAERASQKALAYLFEGVLISVVVQVWLLPFLIVYFHRVAPVSIVLNLWVGVLMAAESFAALFAVLFASISDFFAMPFLALTEALNYLLVSVPGVLSDGDWASWRVAHYSGAMRLIYAVYYLPLVILSAALWKWDPFAIGRPRAIFMKWIGRDLGSREAALASALSVALLGTIAVLHPWSSPVPDGRLRIDFLDVGQGDSAFVTFPDGTTMLVDGGGRMGFRQDEEAGEEIFVPDAPGIGDAVVSPVLWEKGYSEIDLILATHADADHISGLAEVADNFRIGVALLGQWPSGDREFDELAAVIRRRGIPYRIISRGDVLRIGGAMVEVLYPMNEPSAGAASDNNRSVVIRIVYGGRAFLLTGDVEREAEDDLIRSGGTLQADVVKVPHHGSRTSSTDGFIRATGARYAVISVGRRSLFGHPHADVVDRWKQEGAVVLTTGTEGMTSFSTDGRDLVVETFVTK